MSNIDCEALYLQYRGLIYKICNRFKDYCEIDDLMQTAYFGLHKAATTFNEDMDASFTHYVALCVKWVLIREIAKTRRLIRVPVHMNEKIQHYLRSHRELSHELLRDPLQHEIAQRMQIKVKDVEKIEKAINLQNVTSLDAPLTDDGGFTLADTVADADAEYIYAVAERHVLCTQLWAAARGCLRDDMFEVVSDYFRSGINFTKQAEQKETHRQCLHEKYKKALKLLRRNKQIQQIGKDCGYFYESGRHVTLSEWKYTFTSTVEKEVLRREERANRFRPSEGETLCNVRQNLIPKL